MSCWKCGTPLPDGQVECESGCPFTIARKLQPKELPVFGEAPPEPPRYLAIELGFDREKMKDKAAFDAAMDKFATMLGHALADSGLHEFLQRIK